MDPSSPSSSSRRIVPPSQDPSSRQSPSTLLPPVAGSSSSSSPFRPYACANHQVTKGRYITSNDARGYIPVYEYPLNSQWIMMDSDDGYILWTGIWKALSNSKADIVKMLDSQPELASVIRRVRGGYLKIQGTWMPYEIALRFARRVAWDIRYDLIPLFGPTFPDTCLSPDQPGYGKVVDPASGRKRVRRAPAKAQTPEVAPPPLRVVGWTPSAQNIIRPSQHSFLPTRAISANLQPSTAEHHRAPSFTRPRSLSPRPSSNSSNRFSPYPPSPQIYPPPNHRRRERMPEPAIVLPPLRDSGKRGYALPGISALDDMRGVRAQDAFSVLARLKLDDGDDVWDNRSIPAAGHCRSTTSSSSTSWTPPSSASSSSTAPQWNSRLDIAPHGHPLLMPFHTATPPLSRRAYSPEQSPISPATPQDERRMFLDAPHSSHSRSGAWDKRWPLSADTVDQQHQGANGRRASDGGYSGYHHQAHARGGSPEDGHRGIAPW